MKSDDTRKVFLLQVTQLEKKSINSIKLQLQTPLNSWIKEGDIITLRENISLTQPSEEFAYDKYFQSKDIYGTIVSSQMQIQDNSLSLFDRQIIALGGTFLSQMNAVYPPRTAAFLG
jgi:hypothetical protein